MGNDEDTGSPAPRRRPGPLTIMKEAEAVAQERRREEREAAEKRDARQDERTDKAYQLALDAAQVGQASAERTVKRLYALLAASMLANIVLVAMWSNSSLDLSKDGVKVGTDSPRQIPATNE